MKIREIISSIEDFSPLSLQEDWDNSGLQIGNTNDEADSALITLDVTEEVIDEAILHGEKLIISHHPLIFSGLKSITGKSSVERIIFKAIKNNIAIYSAHTNLDFAKGGVSWKMAEMLGLQEISTLLPLKGILKKIVTYVPVDHINQVRSAIFSAGGGSIGNYDLCSFNVEGTGTFRGNETTNPFVGVAGTEHHEKEIRTEIVFPSFAQGNIISALLKAHPYEEVAYDIYPVENTHSCIGLGVVGFLKEETDAEIFLNYLKSVFKCDAIKYSGNIDKKIKKAALCGGSGSSLLKQAIASKADVFVTGDFKYHQYFESENKIIVADIGHFESEQFTKELFYEIVTNKFSKFALRLSEVQTNPVKFLF